MLYKITMSMRQKNRSGERFILQQLSSSRTSSLTMDSANAASSESPVLSSSGGLVFVYIQSPWGALSLGQENSYMAAMLLTVGHLAVCNQ